MGLTREGIRGVVVTELAAGVWGDGEATAEERAALVEWKSEWQDKFYQVYVNGRFAGVTIDSEQRKMVVRLPSSFESSVRIEVFAVEAGEGDVDFGDQLAESRGYSGRVKIRILRSQKLPLDGKVEVFSDNGTGVINYNQRINPDDIRIWNNWQEKCGFGLARFGKSDFAREWSGGIGFGAGLFGESEFGVDADAIEWVSEELAEGRYKFGIRIIDKYGNVSEVSETEEITVIPSAKGVEHLRVMSFDESANCLVLGTQ